VFKVEYLLFFHEGGNNIFIRKLALSFSTEMWRSMVLAKYLYSSIELHSVTSQKVVIFVQFVVQIGHNISCRQYWEKETQT